MEPETKIPEKKVEKTSFLKELIKLIVIAAIIVVPFRLFIAQPFIVDGASMDPTFATGQYLIVDELSYHFEAPARGSVMIFKYPLDTSKYFIKRVIGLPGETVSIKDGAVTITNAAHPQGFLLDEPYVKLPLDQTTTYTVPAGNYFVMGDNRFGSDDSRIWGPVPTKDIIGRPIIRLWPFNLWPGNFNEKE
jgi:signal peptidase I